MTQYFTGVGGFNNGAEGAASFYRGPANRLLGSQAFTTSVMFSAHAPSPGGGPEVLFGAHDANLPDAGWEVRVVNPPGQPGVCHVVAEIIATSGPIVAEALQGPEEGYAWPYWVATLVSDAGLGADGALRFYVNATAYIEQLWAPGDVYVVPSADTQPGIGANYAGVQAAQTTLVLGAAYHNTALSHEQIMRHQIACLEAGTMVDGSIGGAFAAGVPVLDHLYDARRSNAGRGETVFVPGSLNGVSVGNVPRAAASWPDLGAASPVDFTRIDTGPLGQCFTTALKRIG